MLEGRRIIFCDISVTQSKIRQGKEMAWVQVEERGVKYKFTTGNRRLIQKLQYCQNHDLFPFEGELYNTGSSGLADYDIR